MAVFFPALGLLLLWCALCLGSSFSLGSLGEASVTTHDLFPLLGFHGFFLIHSAFIAMFHGN